MGYKPIEWRYGVGDPTGLHSQGYKFFSARHTPDLYIAGRSLGKFSKVSIHASGRSHEGFTPKLLRLRPDLPRHTDIWHTPNSIDLMPAFFVCFPTDDLRKYKLSDRLIKKTCWLKPAPAGRAKFIYVFILNKDTTRVRMLAGQLALKCGPLSDGRKVLLVVEDGAPINIHNIGEVSSRGVPSRFKSRPARAVASIKMDNGTRGWGDFAVDGLMTDNQNRAP